jgi:tetratricopeptide (TPR) repeat protein
MEIVLEDFVPYDQSSLWRVHDAYYAQAGTAAWTGGAIPHFATSNYAIARQHARFVTALARDAADPGGELRILEIGSGLGDFAARFFEALEHGCGEAGRALRRRVRYILSDMSERTVDEAARRPALAALVTEGAVTPATFDLRAPADPLDLEGRPLPGAFDVLIANYVCCVAPAKLVAKTPAGLLEAHLRVSIELPDGTPLADNAAQALFDGLVALPTQPKMFDRLKLDQRLVRTSLLEALGPKHLGAIIDAAAAFPEATVAYHYGFYDFLAAMRERVRPGAIALVTDYGRATEDSLRGLLEWRPRHYGNTLNHDVNFAVLESFCRREGLGIVRTKSPLLAVHTAAIRFAADVPEPLRAAFARCYMARHHGQDLLDFRAAAHALLQAGDHAGAARMFERALRLDPRSTDLRLRAAEACFDANEPRRALAHLRRGMKLDPKRRADFLYPLGRVYAKLGRDGDARRALERAARREGAQAAVHAHLGLACERLGDRIGAYIAFKRFLERERETPLAKEILEKVLAYLPGAG